MKELIVEEWNPKEVLTGTWMVTIKIDGILAVMEEGKILSKGGKPLYNLPEVIDKNFEFAELFYKDRDSTWSIVGASKSPREKLQTVEIFSIVPLDPRLCLGVAINPDPLEMMLMLKAIEKHLSYVSDGIVLVQGNRRIKIKPVTTVETEVIGLVRSTSTRYKGLLKEFITPNGKVGVGLTKEQRKEYMKEKYIGSIIEVKLVAGYTKNGKFRHASFVRMRHDKEKPKSV